MPTNDTESPGARLMQEIQQLLAEVRDPHQKVRVLEIASQIFKAGEAYSAAAGRMRQIPADITLADFTDISKILLSIRDATGADIVNMRLNKTGEIEAAPVFVGWVESEALRRLRLERNEPDPGLYRFGDTVAAREYEETLNAKGAMKERDWTVEITKKSGEQKALVVKAGVMYQNLIGIVVNGGSGRRCVGTLNLGWRPDQARQKAERAKHAIQNWAQDQNSELVKFLKNKFDFGGPTF